METIVHAGKKNIAITHIPVITNPKPANPGYLKTWASI
jgi:hypothetical protein